MTVKLTFLGGVGTVTGSKYLLDIDGRRLMVDCGLFQGFKHLRLRNWRPFPVDPASIGAVLVTHAHIDHSGYLPRLARQGFKGPIYATEATCDLCAILLPDSGHLQEREAEFINRHGISKHNPSLPLYTQEDAENMLGQFSPVRFRQEVKLPGGVTARFVPAGHILGAAIIELEADGRRIVFSGDLGRSDNPTMLDPTPIEKADYLLCESTYGDRLHEARDPEDALAEVVGRTAARGGTVIIPAFAVGRSQTLLYHLERLKRAHRIPDLPVYLDSPMAINVTDVFCRHPEEHRLSAAEAQAACGVATYVRSVEDSKAIDADTSPKIIVSASGMATGGRVLHHLKRFAPDARNTILFAGFQAGGTRGASMTAGAESVKIFGEYVPVRAEVGNLHMLSAHADANEIMAWLKHFRSPPRTTFIVHGEPGPADTLRHRIEEELGWTCRVPDDRESVDLD